MTRPDYQRQLWHSCSKQGFPAFETYPSLWPYQLTGAEDDPEQKVETGWLLAKALRAHPEAV